MKPTFQDKADTKNALRIAPLIDYLTACDYEVIAVNKFIFFSVAEH